MARLYRKPSLQQADRLPVSSYDEAVRRLVEIRLDESIHDDGYAVAVQLVADIFWHTETRVLRDVIVASREIGA